MYSAKTGLAPFSWRETDYRSCWGLSLVQFGSGAEGAHAHVDLTNNRFAGEWVAIGNKVIAETTQALASNLKAARMLTPTEEPRGTNSHFPGRSRCLRFLLP